MFTWLEGVVAGILAGTCGYSGTNSSPSTAAIFRAVTRAYFVRQTTLVFPLVLVSLLNFLTIVSSVWFFTLNLLTTSSSSAEFSRVTCYMRDNLLLVLLGGPGASFLLHFFLECIAKYDSSNEILIPGYLVDLFSKGIVLVRAINLEKDRVQNAL
jgi:hypothetical protein